jgi:hypothetical protein
VTNRRLGTTLPILIALLFVSIGCSQPHQGWEPPLEETSTRFLQSQVDESLRIVRSAQGEAGAHPEQVEDKLDAAARVLELMSGYYLPLLEARQRTYDAHRLLYYGDRHGTRSEIEAVERLLDEVAKFGGTALAPAMKKPLDLVSEAKAAVIAGSDNAPDLIRSLAIDLNDMMLTGGLELPGERLSGR